MGARSAVTHPGGYAGAFLFVDLSRGEIRSEPLDAGFARRYLGGLGFGTRFFLEQLAPAFDGPDRRRNGFPDPVGPDNPFVLMAGPLTGAPMHAVARWTVGARSPLTGLWGEANVGGFFGAELKAAGYDGLVITGASSRPVYLHIEDGRGELRDAAALWGLDTYATEQALVTAAQTPAELGGHQPARGSRRPGQVLSIGPAGENLVRFACLVNHQGHVAGRTGMGAVWGAKRLKAIYVRGSRRLAPAHPDRLAVLRAELEEVYRESIVIEALRAFGTPTQWDIGAVMGDVPMRNWSQAVWDRFDDLGPLTYERKLAPRARTCFACGVRCKREVEISSGPFAFPRGPGPEYETLVSLGSLCLNSDIEAVARANDACNRLGLDTISCGATLAWAMTCRDAGILDPSDYGDTCPDWGDGAGTVEMVERIARREGLGALLGEGSALAAARVGGAAADCLTTVKGLEAPFHDARAFHGMGLAYAVSPRGACHMSGVGYWVESGGMYLPEIEALAEPVDGMTSAGKAALHAASQDYGTFFSSCAGFCNLGGMVLSATQAVAMVNHVTGFDYDLDEVTEVGRRVWYMKRGLSHLFGARAADDQLPPLLVTALEEGPTAGSTPDMSLMLREFYALRRLRPDGLPSQDALLEVGLDDLAELLGV